MPGCHHDHHHAPAVEASPTYRRVLWLALLANAAMFLVEVACGLKAGSVSLLADSLDFLGDSANYGISLFVLGMAVTARARGSLLKAGSMFLFGVVILGIAAYRFLNGEPPEAYTMGIIGFVAMLVNVGVALMLFRWRDGDSNMQSVWLCSRNDAIGNVAVMLAAAAVAYTAQPWPDLLVAVFMAVLAVTASYQVMKVARLELKTGVVAQPTQGCGHGHSGHHH